MTGRNEGFRIRWRELLQKRGIGLRERQGFLGDESENLSGTAVEVMGAPGEGIEHESGIVPLSNEERGLPGERPGDRRGLSVAVTAGQARVGSGTDAV